jgi:hypothetical protein
MTRQPGRGDDRSTTTTAPTILSLSQGRHAGSRGSVAPILGAILERQQAAHGPSVRITFDTSGGHELEADPTLARDLLEPIVAAAFAAATGPHDASDGPALREVDITVVSMPDALEVEIADSGAARSTADRMPEGIADLARRCGAEISAAACAAGGTAVTVRFLRRIARRQAA